MGKKYIDAERYINNLRELRTGDKDTVYEYYDDGIDVAISEAATFPAADVAPRWIPVSERLPEKEGLYLITCVDDRGTPFVDASLYDPPTDWRGAIWDFPNVVAWMERPEPYKGKEEC